MNSISLRLKNNKKAITPVIATIILIAVTLVLALVVGAYTFGLFGSNVKTITITSATLYGASSTGAASLVFTSSNPGSSTDIQSVTISGPGFASAQTMGASVAGSTAVSNGITSFTYTYTNSASTGIVSTGSVYNYVISFVNGQSVSGSLVAQ
ncbi:MAG: type IV pilin [Thaumarchaeota archaeon]|nr:type IV pilin [Nitrososphaerota archaeon]